jgi:hypothetical protein
MLPATGGGGRKSIFSMHFICSTAGIRQIKIATITSNTRVLFYWIPNLNFCDFVRADAYFKPFAGIKNPYISLYFYYSGNSGICAEGRTRD